MISLNEVYFGKTNDVLKIEDLFIKFKTKYAKDKPLKSFNSYIKLSKDKTLREIEQCIENTFGFNGVILTINPDPTLNAYIIPFILDRKTGKTYDFNDIEHDVKNFKNYVIVTERGCKIDKKKFPLNILICLNLGSIFGNAITIPELMSSLLHEIGHTFSKLIMYKGTKFGLVDEKFADQFACMYGYGAELSSAFNKLGNTESSFTKTLKKVPIFNIVVGLGKIMYDINYNFWTMRDTHPTNIARIRYQVEQMELELKDSKEINPKMKKEMQEQLEGCKEQLDKFETVADEDTVADRMFKFYNRNLEKLNLGEIINNKKIEENGSTKMINQAFQALLGINKPKKG